MAGQPQAYSTLTKLGLGVLACNSALAMYNSWGDAGSVAFVVAADAALVLLFLCLRAFVFEQQGGGRGTKAAVWALTTLLTAMFASRVAPLMPLAVGVLVFLCLAEVDKVVRRGGEGGGRINDMAGQYSGFAKVGFAVVTCNAAIDAHGDDPSSAAFVLVSFVGLVLLTGLFVRGFAHAHAGEHGQH